MASHMRVPRTQRAGLGTREYGRWAVNSPGFDGRNKQSVTSDKRGIIGADNDG